MCLKYVHYQPKLKATTSYGLFYVLGLYFASSLMWKFSTYFKNWIVLEYIGIISIQDSLHWVESQMDSNNIYYFEFQTWYLAWKPAYNRCKLKIQLVWCSNYIIYHMLSWTSSTLKSSLSTNYTLGTHSTCISFGLSSFQESIKQIYFPLHPSFTGAHSCDGGFQIYKMTVQELPSELSSK